MKHFISACLKDAGQVLLEHLARGCPARLKENQSSVVTAADLASEALIVARIRGRFPDDGIIAEESGCQPGRSGRTWVIDPLDGRDVVFRLDAEPFDRNYAVVGASPSLHPQILAALRG